MAVLGIAAVAIVLIIPTVSNSQTSRPGYELINFNLDDYSRDEYSQFAIIVFTDRELEQEISAVQRAFRRFQDNLVRYHGNRLLISNAPIDVKDRISLLLGQLQEPDFTNFEGDFSYSDISENPLEYHGVYVKWRGRIANLELGENTIFFELLVGFESGRVLEGRVPVQIDFAADIRGGESVEIIGQISSRDSELKINGRYLRIIRNED